MVGGGAMHEARETAPTCTCGETATHEIARRQTADGATVVLWSDGAVTGRMGFKLPGVPMVRPTSAAPLRTALAAAWLLAGEVSLYDCAELPALYAACRWVAARGGQPGDVRARLAAAEAAPPSLRPLWTVISADRDGRPTERMWRLPRLRWPGLAVFDFCGRAERYEVFSVHRGDRRAPGSYATTTGFRCATLTELAAYLHAIPLAA